MDLEGLFYWVLMAVIVAAVKGIEAYRRTNGDLVIAVADAMTALVVWRLSSSLMIGTWAAALTAGYKWLPINEETFSAAGMFVALLGLRQIMALAMKIGRQTDLREAILFRLAGVSGASMLLTYVATRLTGL